MREVLSLTQEKSREQAFFSWIVYAAYERYVRYTKSAGP